MGIESEALMTPNQVARLLDVSADSVRAWADAGRLKCIRTVAGHRLFRREDVEQLAAQRRASPGEARSRATTAKKASVTPGGQ